MGIEKKGDRFGMYLRHRKSLISYATPLLGSKDDAEDVVQDAFFRFVKDSEDEPLPPKTYLFRIVRNLSFNKRSRRKLESDVVSSQDLPWWALPQQVQSPESELLSNESVTRTAKALEALPYRTKKAFELYRFDQLPLREVAERLEVSVPTAHRLVRDAMERLKQELDGDA